MLAPAEAPSAAISSSNARATVRLCHSVGKGYRRIPPLCWDKKATCQAVTVENLSGWRTIFQAVPEGNNYNRRNIIRINRRSRRYDGLLYKNS